MTVAPVSEGDVLVGKYRVDRVLGVGGMGVVVAATHLQLEQKVALKFMLPDAFANPEALGRFLREARAAVRLKSEHVARVSDTGTFDNGSPYIVMEFLDGTDLAAEISRQGPMPVATVAEYVVQACDALAEAHVQGIVHRDLKPGNLFLTRRADGSPLVKVLDFGISKVSSLTDGGLAMTKTAAMMGSPLYMSPEQMKSAKDVDARTDVWSMGVVVYEMLAGSVPFNSETLGGLLAKVITEAPPPIEQLRRDLPPALVALVHYCLEKDVTRRCPNVGELARALRPFCPPRTQPLVERICGVLGVNPAGQAAPPPSTQSFQHTALLASSSSSFAAQPVNAQTANAWGADGAKPKMGVGAIIAAAAVAFVALAIGGVVVVTNLMHKPPPASDAPAKVATAATTATSEQPPPPPPPALATAAPAPTTTVTKATTMTGSPAPVATHPRATSAASASATTKPTPAATPTVAATATATATVKKPGMLDTSE